MKVMSQLFPSISDIWADKDYIGLLSTDVFRIMYSGKKNMRILQWSTFWKSGNLPMQFSFLGFHQIISIHICQWYFAEHIILMSSYLDV